MPKGERRKHPRIEISVLLDLYIRGLFKPRGRGCITNISLGGLRLETEADFEIDTPLDLRLPLTEEVPLDFIGEIRWRKPGTPGYIYGVEFTELEFASKRKLQKYILAKLEKPSESG